MFKNKLKTLLNKKKLSIGSWISIGDMRIADIFCGSGFDWLTIDLEHSTINLDKAGDLIRVISLSGVTPLVRLTSLDENQIKRVMDAGAEGIIVPNICNAKEAKLAVASTRYSPIGNRGVGLARAQGYGENFEKYLEWQKKNPIVIVQIENIKAIDNLKDIFNVEGIDGFMIGPYDLSASMGIPGDFNSPEFKKIVNLILEKGKESDIAPGIHIVEPEINLLKKAIKDGFKFIAYSVDIRMLSSTAKSFQEILNV